MKGHIMGVFKNTRVCVALVFLFCLTWLATSDAVSCDSCGRECASACGTKHFRTCCFNYLRKRSYPQEPKVTNAAVLLDNDYSGVIPSQELLNSILRNEKEINALYRRAQDFDSVPLNKKREREQINGIEYP